MAGVSIGAGFSVNLNCPLELFVPDLEYGIGFEVLVLFFFTAWMVTSFGGLAGSWFYPVIP